MGWVTKGQATGDSLYYLLPSDSIVLTVDEWGEKIFEHQMEKGQTLYSLADFYGMELQELYFYNPACRGGRYAPGSRIKIPIPNRCILRYANENYTPYSHIPVYYQVKRGETLYRIAKVHFKLTVEEVMRRNGLLHSDLQPGQLLFMGWMSIEGIPRQYRQGSGPYAEALRQMELQYKEQVEGRPLRQSRGGATWDVEKAGQRTDLFALHRKVPRGQVVEVVNPWNRRKIYVKVLGDIPPKLYGDEVIIVLSPSAAQLLGAVDPEFYVNIAY